MADPVEVALVGCGYWGPNLARNFHQVAGSRLAMCCDLDEKSLAKLKRLYPHIRTTTSFAQVMGDPSIQAVAIATPAATHYALAKEALLHGKHVLIEKPITTSSTQGKELVELAQARDRVLMVGHTFEYNPAVWKMKELLTSGAIGDLYYIYSTRVNLGRIQQDLNALWSIAPHDVSIMLYLLEDMPKQVISYGASYLSPGVEDVTFMTLFFDKGVIGHVHASWLDPNKVRRVTLVGSKKMIVYDDIDNEAKLRVYDKGVSKQEGPVFGEFQLRIRSGDIYIPDIDLREPLALECSHFVECIKTGATPKSDGLSGLRVVRVLEAAQESLERGGAKVKVS